MVTIYLFIHKCLGVVLSIVKASVRLKCHQTILLQDLGKAFHCNENLDGLAMACIRMLPAEEAANKDEIKITVISSLLFQELLDFNKPIQVRWKVCSFAF